MVGFGLLRELASGEPADRWLYGLVQLAKWFLCGFCSMFLLCVFIILMLVSLAFHWIIDPQQSVKTVLICWSTTHVEHTP